MCQLAVNFRFNLADTFSRDPIAPTNLLQRLLLTRAQPKSGFDNVSFTFAELFVKKGADGTLYSHTDGINKGGFGGVQEVGK
jgi:hypothetical protein